MTQYFSYFVMSQEPESNSVDEYGFREPRRLPFNPNDLQNPDAPLKKIDDSGISDIEKGLIIDQHIEDGLELIRSGEYQQASIHFENAEVAQRVGIWLFNEMEYPLKVDADSEVIPNIAWELINLSYFSWGSMGRIKLLKVRPDISRNIIIPPALYHEMSLAYAEPWLFAKEWATNFTQFVPDLNILEYLYARNVPMTRTFVSINTNKGMHRKKPGDVIGGERLEDIPQGGETRKD